MRRLAIGIALFIFGPSAVHAQESVRVAIGDFTGPGASTKRIAAFQSALKRRRGVGIESTRNYKSKARRMGVERDLPDDPNALIDVSAAVDVDAVIYMRSRKKGRKDRELSLKVFAGRNGRLIGEHVLRVRRGRFTKTIWKKAARSVESDLYASLDVRAPPPRAPEPVEPEVPVRRSLEPLPPDEPDEPRGPTGLTMFRLAGGLSLLARSFTYKTVDGSPQFAEGGIEYQSAMVPGFALDAEIYPLLDVVDGFARNFGLGLRYEKVFVSTEQEVELNDGRTRTQPLDTSHNHILIQGLYRYRFSADPTAIELMGGLGFGVLSFEVADNNEYNGVSYRYLDLTIGGYVPLTTPLAAVDVRLSLLPFVGLGDTVQELGGEASTFGYRIYGGLGSVFSGEFTASAGLEFTSLASEVTGSGRGGRQGETAEDSFVGVRLLGGYRF